LITAIDGIDQPLPISATIAGLYDTEEIRPLNETRMSAQSERTYLRGISNSDAFELRVDMTRRRFFGSFFRLNGHSCNREALSAFIPRQGVPTVGVSCVVRYFASPQQS
jgi:hypothetical protein